MVSIDHTEDQMNDPVILYSNKHSHLKTNFFHKLKFNSIKFYCVFLNALENRVNTNRFWQKSLFNARWFLANFLWKAILYYYAVQML